MDPWETPRPGRQPVEFGQAHPVVLREGSVGGVHERAKSHRIARSEGLAARPHSSLFGLHMAKGGGSNRRTCWR